MRDVIRIALLASLKTLRRAGLCSALLAIAALFSTAQTLNVLHEFHNTPDGSQSQAGLVRDVAGNLYGTTTAGGSYGSGIAFRLTQSGGSWILHKLYDFGAPGDSAVPYAPLVIGPDGALYGTASAGGNHNQGTVFRLTPPATFCRSVSCPWIETVLHSFGGSEDGAVPYGAVVFDGAGNLYGTTDYGGTDNGGVVFELTRTGASWTETLLHSFTGAPDGSGPMSGLAIDAAGNLYGTNTGGGTDLGGTVYQVTRTDSGWSETVLHSFDYTQAAAPWGGLIVDRVGNLYGTTAYGGGNNGTVFEMSFVGGQWHFDTIYDLNVGPGGIGGPFGSLVMDGAGNLYGTTLEGGLNGCGFGYGCGEIFELSPSSGGWNFSSLYQFRGDMDGEFPWDGLILDPQGNLYGTTWAGGDEGNGTVFELAP